MARSWRSILRLERLKLILVRSQLEIAWKPAILMLKSGLSVSVLVTSVGSVGGLGELHDYRNRECRL
jgi:hypothetical protein